jgi:hypothetical protein
VTRLVPALRTALSRRGSRGLEISADQAYAGRGGEKALNQKQGEPPGGGNPAAQALGARLLEDAHRPFAARICGQAVTEWNVSGVALFLEVPEV